MENKEELIARVHAAAEVIANGDEKRSREEALNQYVALRELLHVFAHGLFLSLRSIFQLLQDLHQPAVRFRIACRGEPRHGGGCGAEVEPGRRDGEGHLAGCLGVRTAKMIWPDARVFGPIAEGWMHSTCPMPLDILSGLWSFVESLLCYAQTIR